MTPNKFTHAGLDWIPHTPGDPMPCPGHVEVRIFQRCDAKSSLQELEVSQEASFWNWSECGASSIIGWHPIEEQPEWPNAYTTVETGILRRVLDLLESGDIEQAKHELRKELE